MVDGALIEKTEDQKELIHKCSDLQNQDVLSKGNTYSILHLTVINIVF
jgi:hypothetical protein